MTTPITIGFFNNKGGVGKTTLAFHLGWMFCKLGHRTLLVDLDPQSNLSAFALHDPKREKLRKDGKTVDGALSPLFKGTGDFQLPHIEPLHPSPAPSLLVGSFDLAERENDISQSWPKCNDGDERAFRVISAFARLIKSAKRAGATVALVDVGPNIGAINRSALIACDYVIIPLAPDSFSLQVLQSAGHALNRWREGWSKCLKSAPGHLKSALPSGKMRPLGYVVNRFFQLREGRPAKAFREWEEKIPLVYNKHVLRQETGDGADKHLLARLKDYYSLMAMAQSQRVPIFAIKGVRWGRTQADAESDFKELATRILDKIDKRQPVTLSKTGKRRLVSWPNW